MGWCSFCFESDDAHTPIHGGRGRRKGDSLLAQRGPCPNGKLDMKFVGLVVVLFFTLAMIFPAFTSRETEVALLRDELEDAKQAMKELKKYAMQQPWQDFGKCTADLTAAKLSLAELEDKMDEAGFFLSLNRSDGSLASFGDRRICPECPRPRPNPDCAPTLPCPRIDVPAPPPDAKTSEQTTVEIRDNILRSLNTTEEVKRLQLELDASKETIRLLTQQLGNVLGSQPVAPGTAGGCTALKSDIAKYLNYPVYGDCPDDWMLVQKLVFERGCMQLPRRRCLARTPKAAVIPRPKRTALWDQRALDDRNVRWAHYGCDSFKCLNLRAKGECHRCFNLTLEKWRWETRYRGAPTMDEVVKLMKGGLRIGLDIGGGTGSFAAKMAAYNVTIVTSGMNMDGGGRGLPYMETIALRGLIGLYLPFRARLPFFDNTMDMVHAVNAIKYPTLFAMEELLYEWDRVLRPGGVMWWELYYAPKADMPAYIAAIDRLGYQRLYWNVNPKPEAAERGGEHLYLNCVIEKPVRLS